MRENPYQSPEPEGPAPPKPRRSGLNRLLFDMFYPLLLIIALPIVAAMLGTMAFYLLAYAH